ncbi:hypothetical protein AB0D97_33845 [Streptomyces roseus]|uniref:hypothetical protein n=1 Tax=Streptomyces roseus TaxID=66430 RepID=UPI0033C023FA
MNAFTADLGQDPVTGVLLTVWVPLHQSLRAGPLVIVTKIQKIREFHTRTQRVETLKIRMRWKRGALKILRIMQCHILDHSILAEVYRLKLAPNMVAGELEPVPIVGPYVKPDIFWNDHGFRIADHMRIILI